MTCVEFMHDAKSVTSGDNGSIYVWDTQYVCIHKLDLHEHAIRTLCVTDCNIITGGSDQQVHIINAHDLSNKSSYYFQGIPLAVDSFHENIIIGDSTGEITYINAEQQLTTVL